LQWYYSIINFNKEETPKVTEKKPLFSKPDAACCGLESWFGCMASEGIMFDWSGVYFKDVVKAQES
jgi:hypothetical protein